MAKQQAPAVTGGMSLRTKDATSGGGTEGALATITEIEFIDEFTYGGRFKNDPQAALSVVFNIEGFDKPWPQNYTLGKSTGYEVINKGDAVKGKFNNKSAAFQFLTALEAAAEASDIDLDELLEPLDGGGHSVRPLEGRQVILTNIKWQPVSGDEKDMIVISKFVGEAATNGNGKNGKHTSRASSSDDIEAQLGS